MRLKLFFVWFTLFVVVACNSQNTQRTEENIKKAPSVSKYEFENNGRDTTIPIFKSTYEVRRIDTITSIKMPHNFDEILERNLAFLNKKKKRTHQIDTSINISDHDLLSAARQVKDWLSSNQPLSELLEGYQIRGEQLQGNVQITGYYIPVLKVRSTPDSIYRFPLYEKPKKWQGAYPTRAEIDSGKVLENQGLELAWSADLLSNFIMQVQGSGVVEYEDGRRELLSYGGQNGHDYRSIGRYLVDRGHVSAEEISLDAIRNWTTANPDSLTALLNYNPSYIFFKKTRQVVQGAAQVELEALTSVAVDRRYIPLGSTLLAAVPVLDESGSLVGHEYRIVFAHDTGGSIQGPGRMDFFCGIGEEGERRASAMKHYGQVWLLLPKK